MPESTSPAEAATDSRRIKPTPTASAPVPARPAPPAEPQVVVFTEQEYSCQPNDTFESLSKRYYSGTDKYAAALRRHNQNHARASDQMASSGRITPGEKIFIPPADILEQRYPDAIEKAPTPAPGAVPASFTPSGSPAPPPTMTPVPAPSLTPVSPPPSSSPPPPAPPPPAPLPNP